MAAIGLVAFVLGTAMSLAPNTIGDQIMGVVFALGGLILIVRAYRAAQR